MSNGNNGNVGNNGNNGNVGNNGNSGNVGNICKYIFPGLHTCLTSQNPEGRPHALAYVDATESFSRLPPRRIGAAEAIALYMRQQPRHSSGVRRTCVCCAAAFKVPVGEVTPYDPIDSMKPRCSALICTTCTSANGNDNDDQNFFVCIECTRLTQEALDEAKKCVGGAFGISRTLRITDMLAFHLFLQRIDASIARAFLAFPAQVGFNTTVYQGTVASVDYIEALSVFNRARHAASVAATYAASPAAIIYTAFHTFFVTQKCLNIAVAARSSVDSSVAAFKAAKTASKAAASMPLSSSLPPAAAALPPAAAAASLQECLQERKRKRDESNYTCRGLDMEIRLAEAHRLNMTLAIEQIRAVLRTRD